jgi:membrane associated rhomboid family serine protease
VSWITAMFLHGGWDHILGNMLFLAIFGKNVEDAFGPLLYLGFYFAAMMLQAAMTLWFGMAAEARVPEPGASGAIAAVLGAYFLLYPGSRIRTWIFPVFLVKIPAWSSSGCGSCTSSSRRAPGCSAPRRTGAASRSSRTSAGLSSAWW